MPTWCWGSCKMLKLKKEVTLCYIRSILDRKEKINIEAAIDMIEVDPSHSKYTRDKIKKTLKKGVRIQLDNHTLQIVGVGYDKDPRNTIRRKEAKKKKGR